MAFTHNADKCLVNGTSYTTGIDNQKVCRRSRQSVCSRIIFPGGRQQRILRLCVAGHPAASSNAFEFRQFFPQILLGWFEARPSHILVYSGDQNPDKGKTTNGRLTRSAAESQCVLLQPVKWGFRKFSPFSLPWLRAINMNPEVFQTKTITAPRSKVFLSSPVCV